MNSRDRGSRPPAVHVHTLGCPKNEADSAVLERRLASLGIAGAREPEGATHIVINTCGFIEEARRESVDAILAAAAGYPAARVLVLGCMVERAKEELAAGIPEVHGWFGLGEVDELVEALKGAMPAGASGHEAAYEAPSTATGALPPAASSLTPTAYVKISDGCDHLCTFCAIPYIKGPYRASSLAQVMSQVEGAVEAGVREVVLVGQDTTLWSEDGLDVLGLVDAIAEDERVAWVRLLYLQPEHVDERFLAGMAARPKLCRYLDIPFQHAHPEVLRSMGRTGDASSYLGLLEAARTVMPDVSIRSTFIVGFPGERDEHVEVLADFARAASFDHAGIFAFSPEEETVAYALRPRVPRRVVRERMSHLGAILAESTESAARGRVGDVVDVLIGSEVDEEGAPEGTVGIGRTPGQAPDVDGVTYVVGAADGRVIPGAIVRTLVTDSIGYDLVASLDAT